MSEQPFLSRWSRLKKAAKAAPAGADVAPGAQAKPAPAAVPAGDAAAPPAAPPTPPEPAPLPPVESLTPESDFSPFMAGTVEESLRRRALKTLFQDPRFNVMDGLDTYIGDYTQADPLPDGWLEKMGQLAHLGDQPARVEEERKASERAQAAAAETPPQATNCLPGEPPATPAARPASDTSDPADDVPPVGEYESKRGRLT